MSENKTAAKSKKGAARQNRSLKILFCASECVPFIKTGGLADVAGTLPVALAAMGHDVRVMLPKYRRMPSQYASKLTHICDFTIKLGWREQYCGIELLELGGVKYYFVDNEYYFGRDYVYGSFSNDEAERFGFFSKAILEAMPRLDFFPDILHLNDWQTGAAAALHRLQYRALPKYRDIRTVFTVHNLRYQGVFDMGFTDELLGLGAACHSTDSLEYYGCVNYMKAGLVCADRITTVSPTYANEIQTPTYGETLDGVLRARSYALSGIMNGIDNVSYDPAYDPLLPANYSLEDNMSMSGKGVCKAALQREFGLEEDPSVPLVAMVTRLTGQKGLDLVEAVINELMGANIQLAVLGNGDIRYEQLFSWAAWRYPGRISARIEFSEPLARLVYAGADAFLMPSLFEPCGLAQLIAMRYGALPIVRETGGLKDSVTPYNRYTGGGDGFSFKNYNAHDMLHTVERAAALYRDDKPAWQRLVENAMQKRFTWDESAVKYEELYRSML